jgi:hypothetical protein
MIWKYDLYGRTVTSNAKLPLKQGASTANKTLSIRLLKSKNFLLHKENLWNANEGIILINEKNNYFLYLDKRYSAAHKPYIILNSILPHILSLQGSLILHGSCITKNKKGIVFAGLSGVGKSSIAYKAQDKDFSIISDDKILIEKTLKSHQVSGGNCNLRLIQNKNKKNIIKKSVPAARYETQSMLSSVFILKKVSKIKKLKFTELNGLDKIKKILPHILVLKHSSEKSKIKIVNTVFNTFESTKVWIVNYPHDYKNKLQLLNEVQKLVGTL